MGGVLLLLLPALMLTATAWGETGAFSLGETLRALFAGDLGTDEFIVKLRLYRALCAAGVGGSLALGGAMAQGLFRNPLADPGLLGVSGGAGLGAMLGIAMLGGHADIVLQWIGAGGSPESFLSSLGLLAIPVTALVGAGAAAVAVYWWSARGSDGQVSISGILLAGLALNSLAGAAMAMLQALLLDDLQITRAIVSWGFGALNDRGTTHVAIVWTGAAFALAAIPLIGLELDLLAGGDSDAEALGANTRRVKTLALMAIALSTATAVSVCGQIAFVGLLVPHLVRKIAGPRHRALMLLSFLTGAALLLMVVIIQDGLLPTLAKSFFESGHTTLATLARRLALLQPGVTTSLLGAPFFLILLRRSKRSR